MSERMLFIGVSTAGSRSFDLFPHWATIFGLDARLHGYDVPPGAPPATLRNAVGQIAADPAVRGGLVTAHKVDVFRHAGDLFDELDESARLCREVSCISKRDGALVGHAKDPITAGRTLNEFLGADHWAAGAHALCLGAGGAGTAITVHLLGRDQPPARVVVTDRDPGRLAALEAVVDELGAGADVELGQVSSTTESDELVARLPAGSLVVNATGLGKDVPGSPISDAALFPERAVVWELNYRGGLRFLEQARRQQDARRLELHDGWRYFLHGWSEVIAEVFHVELTPELFADLARAAEPVSPTDEPAGPEPAPRPPG